MASPAIEQEEAAAELTRNKSSSSDTGRTCETARDDVRIVECPCGDLFQLKRECKIVPFAAKLKG